MDHNENIEVLSILCIETFQFTPLFTHWTHLTPSLRVT